MKIHDCQRWEMIHVEKMVKNEKFGMNGRPDAVVKFITKDDKEFIVVFEYKNSTYPRIKSSFLQSEN